MLVSEGARKTYREDRWNRPVADLSSGACRYGPGEQRLTLVCLPSNVAQAGM
jgi:hypothetical protein